MVRYIYIKHDVYVYKIPINYRKTDSLCGEERTSMPFTPYFSVSQRKQSWAHYVGTCSIPNFSFRSPMRYLAQ